MLVGREVEEVHEIIVRGRGRRYGRKCVKALCAWAIAGDVSHGSGDGCLRIAGEHGSRRGGRGKGRARQAAEE